MLFDEFCAWAAVNSIPVDEDVRNTYTMAGGPIPNARSASDAVSAEKKRVAEAAKKRRAERAKSDDKYSSVARKLKKLAEDERKLTLMWRKIDRSADGSVSLGELHQYMVSKHGSDLFQLGRIVYTCSIRSGYALLSSRLMCCYDCRLSVSPC